MARLILINGQLYEETDSRLVLVNGTLLEATSGGGAHVLTADDLRSASQISQPAAALNPPQYAHVESTTDGYRWTTPNSAAANITGIIDLQVYVRMDKLDNNTSQVLFNKWESGQNSWTFYIDSDARLRFYNSSYGNWSSVQLSYGWGKVKWLRAYSDPSVPELKFYTSDDGESWTQLGATRTNITAYPTVTTSRVEVGSFGTLYHPIGAIYRARAYDDGVLVLDFNPNEAAVGDNQTWDAVFTGETWTAEVGAYIRSGHALYQYTGLQSGSQISTPIFEGISPLTADDIQSGSQLSTPAIGDDLVRLVPIGDLFNGGNWTTEIGGSTNIYLSIDETPSFDDANYIQTPSPAAFNGYSFDFGSAVPKLNANDKIILKYRAALEENTTVGQSVYFYLRDGETLITSWLELVDYDSPETKTYTLSQAHKDLITDFDNLNLYIIPV